MLVLRLVGWEGRWDMEAERAIVVDVPAAWACILSLLMELRLVMIVGVDLDWEAMAMAARGP